MKSDFVNERGADKSSGRGPWTGGKACSERKGAGNEVVVNGGKG